MDTDNSCCALRYQLLYAQRIKIVRRTIDIAKDGSDLLPFKGMRDGYKSKRRNDNFAHEPGCLDSYFETYRGITDGDAMLHAKSVGYTPLKFVWARSGVGQPSPIQKLVDTREKSVAQDDN